MDENEIKKAMSERSQQDSFTTGTAAKDGAWKTYFDVDEENKKDVKDTKVYKLLQLIKSVEAILPTKA